MAMPLKKLTGDAEDFYSCLIGSTEAANEPLNWTDIDVSDIKPVREYPLFWHCRRGDSDKSFVMARMRWIPTNLKHAVSLQFERLYAIGGREGRWQAKTFLHDLAKQYRNIEELI